MRFYIGLKMHDNHIERKIVSTCLSPTDMDKTVLMSKIDQLRQNKQQQQQKETKNKQKRLITTRCQI